MRFFGLMLRSSFLASALCFGPGVTMARDVTDERLNAANAEPENWLMVHGDYAATRFSLLDQINRGNAKDLRLAFMVGLGGSESTRNFANSAMEATPLAEDGFLYLTDGWSNAYKIDVRSGRQGRIVWKTDPGLDRAIVPLPVNRGVALYRDMVLMLTGDGRVVGMAKRNGRVLFDVSVRTSPDEAFTAAPLVVKNRLIIGATGGDMGARGWIGAFDLDKRDIAWRWYATPAPGEPGSETWPAGLDGGNKGGAIWATGAYDPAANRIYWGTGNPRKANDSAGRKGDNLFTDSTVALDADTGRLEWYFQYTPNDPFDYDEVGSQTLIPLKQKGGIHNILSHFGRNGFYYTLDAGSGRFIKGEQYVRALNWTKGLDPRTGKPLEYDRRKQGQSYAVQPERDKGAVHVCPEQRGGVNFWPPAYSPLSGLTYAGTWEGCHDVTVNPGKFMGGSIQDRDRVTGSLTAVDPATASVTKRHLSDYPNTSGVTVTAGRIVVTAFEDGTIEVLNDETLDPLYRFNVGTFIGAPPMVYAVDGKEYIAVITGGGLPPSQIGPYANDESYSLQSIPALLVFSL
jgi:alcohol dehydrogenase (cytochrome c)